MYDSSVGLPSSLCSQSLALPPWYTTSATQDSSAPGGVGSSVDIRDQRSSRTSSKGGQAARDDTAHAVTEQTAELRIALGWQCRLEVDEVSELCVCREIMAAAHVYDVDAGGHKALVHVSSGLAVLHWYTGVRRVGERYVQYLGADGRSGHQARTETAL